VTPEQLAAARASHWRQDAQPLLTLEDATRWLEGMQLALYLPRKSHVLAPAPSFVEAVSGEGSATPSPDAIAQAHALLVRMVTEGSAVPLNLFGTPGEQPDFIVAIQALPHLAALQADRNWKKPPSRTGPGKVSPLAIEIWKLLQSDGAMTAEEIRTNLGHELTEAATIRGLSELWQNMRVAPLPRGAGEPAEWELLSITHKKEMAAAGTMAQSAALSMLVSNYLQSVVTGTGEDIEAFLSPVASRSRLRDVIRGLTATRQLKSLSMDAQTFLFIDGTLPDMPEVVAATGEGAEAKPAFMGRSAYRERMLNRGKEEEEKAEERSDKGNDAPRRAPFRPSADRPGLDRPAGPRRFAAGGGGARDSRSSGDSAGPRRTFGSKPFGAKPFRSGAPRSSEGRPPFRRTDGESRPTFSSRAEGAGGDRPFTPRPFTPRAGDRPSGGRPAFGRKPGGFSKPGFSKPGFSRPSFGASDGDRPRSPRPFTPREGGEGERPSYKRTDFGKSGGYGKDKGTARPAFGARGAGGARSAGGDRPFRPRPDGDRPRSGSGRPFTPREGGARPFSDRPKSFSDRSGGDDAVKNKSRAGFMSRAGSRPGRPTGDRPRPDRAAGDRPSAGRPRPPRADGDRPYTPRPAGGASRPFTPRPRDGEGRPPRKFDAKPSFPRRDAGASRGGSDSRAPRREGGSSGYPSNPNRPSRAPKAGGSFVKRDGPPSRPGSARPSSGRPSSGRPSSGGSGRPPARGGKPSFGGRPGGGASSPGRNPGGTGRPGGPRVGGGSSRPGGASSRPAGRPGGSTSRPSRPGGMKPPTRKPRPEKPGE
jgi:23S rRNA pseudouridine2605 synthase